MKKNIHLGKLLSAIFLIQTGIVFFALYTGIDNWITNKFIGTYIISIILYIIYIVTMTIINIRKLERRDLKKRVFMFVKSFILFSLLNYICNYFKISNSGLLNAISIAFGGAFGIAFWDVVFLKKKEKYSLDYVYKKDNIR
ncbi:hypothetical protein [Tepidibacter sp. Z1-5]|uniref:hypothetical protein n=1 Tax=Tepidibacter sp. Z1-5 TaxID=3134138 RepID=UPI0030BFCCE1